MNVALEGGGDTHTCINSLDQTHVAFSDSLGDTAKPDHQPLVDMARNYRSSNSRTTNRARPEENQPKEDNEDTPSTLESLRSQQQEDFSCLECLKSG